MSRQIVWTIDNIHIGGVCHKAVPSIVSGDCDGCAFVGRPLDCQAAVREHPCCRSDIIWTPVEPEPAPPGRTPPPLLPADAKARKGAPIARGVLDYFPLALAEVARISKAGNDQHNPGQPLHWDRTKSTDHADCIVRHLIERGTVDTDGMRHTAKVAWRALALLQAELESDAG
jgi:hypothetical protein